MYIYIYLIERLIWERLLQAVVENSTVDHVVFIAMNGNPHVLDCVWI